MYEYKCQKCKRPAEYEIVSINETYSEKRPHKTCANKRCGGKIVLMYD